MFLFLLFGRGAIQTKGTCNLGKLNYYLGKGAADDKRESRYKDVDFCSNPEAICLDDRTMEMRWVVAMFEWTERIQTYNSNGWNYIEQLHKAAEGDLLNDLKFERNNFIDEVGGILEQGCTNPPCDTVETMHRLNWANERKANFRVALESFGLPIKSAAFREIESILIDGKDAFEEVILRSINPKDQTTYQSYRYQFSDFLEALRLVSLPAVGLYRVFGSKQYIHDFFSSSHYRCPTLAMTINTFISGSSQMEIMTL